MSDARPSDRTWVHGLLFVLTVLTACFAGLGWSASYLSFEAGASGADVAAAAAGAFRDPRVFPLSALYAAVLMTILLGHELGHYLTCRRHGIPATLPFFLPGPPFIGTFGAFIRIKSPVFLRRQIFDIGVSGPLAGFALALPALAAGLAASRIAPFVPSAGGTISFGEPLLFRLLTALVFGRVPDGSVLVLHPVGFAGKVGLLVTALNLMPIGQLDGGHFVYALLGAKAKLLSFVMMGVLAMLGVFFHVTWLILAGLLLFFESRSKSRLKHPPVIDEGAPLGRTRLVLSVAVVLVFILSFIPDPVKNAGLIDLLNVKW